MDSQGSLLERDFEVRELTSMLRHAAAGRGGLALVTGLPGLGKTALLRRLAEEADGVTLWWATAGELEDQAPFGVIRQLLSRPLMALSEVERARLADGPARPAVDHILGAQVGQVDQAAMFLGLSWLVESLAGGSALLVVVDDAQWADEESLLFLLHLAPRLIDLRVMIVLGVRDQRPEHRGAALAGLLAVRSARNLRPAPLSTESVGVLLSTDDPVLAASAAEVTGGNPFLAVALAGILEIDAGTHIADVRAVVPESVIASVTQRLTVLPESDRELASALAVLVAAPLRVAASLAGLTMQEAAASADRLRDVGLLASGDQLAFRHSLLQSAVLATAGRAGVADRRRRAASLLANEADGLHQAAAHLMRTEGAGDVQAVEILARAAADALAAGSPRTAVDLMLRAAAEPPPIERLPGVLLALGDAQLHAADPNGLTSLQTAFEQAADPVTRAQAALGLSAAWNMAGAYTQASTTLQEAFDELLGLAPRGPVEEELILIVEASLIATARQVPDQIAEARSRLAARPDLLGSTPGERTFLAAQVFDAVGTNQPGDEVARLARLALSGHNAAGAPAQVERHSRNMARLTFMPAGHLQEALTVAEDAIAAGYAEGSTWEAVAGHYARAIARQAMGDIDGAETDLIYMLETAGDSTDLGRRLGTAALIDVLVARGDLNAAHDRAGRTTEADLAAQGYSGTIPLLRALAALALASGDSQRALTLANECGRQAKELVYDAPGWCSWRSVAAPALWQLGQTTEAQSLAAEEVELVQPTGSATAIGAARRMLGELTGDLAMLKDAESLLAGSAARLEHARAQIALGGVLRRAGLDVEARDALSRGRDAALRCGAAPLAKVAAAELAAAGGRRRRVEVTGPNSLTASERRTCDLAVTGASNREIAQQLFVSAKTVETHLTRAYRKLGISRREQIADALTG